jgi:hypothetical protein
VAGVLCPKLGIRGVAAPAAWRVCSSSSSGSDEGTALVQEESRGRKAGGCGPSGLSEGTALGLAPVPGSHWSGGGACPVAATLSV